MTKQYFVLFFAPVLLSGCVAAAAGAGAAAGSSMGEDEDVKDLEYWLKTNDATTRIGTAMQRREVVEGMNRTHVKLVMPAKDGPYKALPGTRKDLEGEKELWIYEPEMSTYSTYRITLNEGEVSSVETIEGQGPDIDSPMGSGG